MKSSVDKRSIVIDGHKTSVSLEDPFWTDPEKNRAYRATDTIGVGRCDRRYARTEQSILGDPPVCSSPLPLWWRQANGGGEAHPASCLRKEFGDFR